MLTLWYNQSLLQMCLLIGSQENNVHEGEEVLQKKSIVHKHIWYKIQIHVKAVSFILNSNFNGNWYLKL